MTRIQAFGFLHTQDRQARNYSLMQGADHRQSSAWSGNSRNPRFFRGAWLSICRFPAAILANHQNFLVLLC
jgi:hypothetical protein